jgi:hypothetical protein
MDPEEEITSDELDGVLDEAETVTATCPDGPTEVHSHVAADPETLHELEARTASEGKDLSALKPRLSAPALTDQP